MATTRLDRGLVARTALRLLNDVGLEGLTLRAIAEELGVKAPALYWHFEDKQALLDEMATEMMRRMVLDLPDPPPGCWHDVIARAMHGLRKHLLRYRDGAKVYGGTRLTDAGHARSQNAYLGALAAAGFTTAAAARAWFTAYSYTIGFVIEEQAAGDARGRGGKGYDLNARATHMAEFPLAAAAGYEMFARHDEGFEAGLAAVIAGIGLTLLPHEATPTEPKVEARAEPKGEASTESRPPRPKASRPRSQRARGGPSTRRR